MGITFGGVRLDSGDLGALAKSVRTILDSGALGEVSIFASGGLAETAIAQLLDSGAPIAGFGVGTSLTTASAAPALDCAYKLQEYAGRARRKRSEGKATWRARKQVWRGRDAAGRIAGDVASTEGDRQPGTAVLQALMRGGGRIAPAPSLDEARNHAADQLDTLPSRLRTMSSAPPHKVRIGESLRALVAEVDRFIDRDQGEG